MEKNETQQAGWKKRGLDMNKVSWFAKQLQHKTGNETLQLSLNDEEYRLTAQQSFELESYAASSFTACAVSAGTDSGYAAVIIPGQPYRLQISGHSLLFKIMMRKILFYDSTQAIAAK
jgi:hypothetical protein